MKFTKKLLLSSLLVFTLVLGCLAIPTQEVKAQSIQGTLEDYFYSNGGKEIIYTSKEYESDQVFQLSFKLDSDDYVQSTFLAKTTMSGYYSLSNDTTVFQEGYFSNAIGDWGATSDGSGYYFPVFAWGLNGSDTYTLTVIFDESFYYLNCTGYANGSSSSGSSIPTKTKSIPKVKIKSVKQSSYWGHITVKTNAKHKSTGGHDIGKTHVDGVQVQMFKDGKKVETQEYINSNTVWLTELIKGHTYKIRVRAYNTVSGKKKYGKWSKKVKMKWK